MKQETIAIHGGYEVTTKAAAVPIYQTAAYAFDRADHAAALFNLEADGFRYTRIGNPTTAILERRVAALEGGGAGLVRLQRAGCRQPCCHERYRVGMQYRLTLPALRNHAHPLYSRSSWQGVTVRFAECDHPAAIQQGVT
jgi:O-acetylhomoserine (thiol)-lyase